MRNRNKLVIGLAAVAAAMSVAASPSWADRTNIDGYYYELPKGSDANLDAVRALILASDGMGQTRRGSNAAGSTTNSLGGITASYEYKGSGTFNGAKADVVSIHFDYRIPAVRTDVTYADGKRVVTVAADGVTWDESTPGLFSAASKESVADRLLPVYLLPPAVVFLGQKVADKITVARNQNGDQVLTIPVADLGSDLKATIGADGHVSATEIAYKGKVYSGEYSEYLNDHMDYHVFGPHKIVQKVDGQVVTDLELEYHWTNPYMLFRTPKEVAQK